MSTGRHGGSSAAPGVDDVLGSFYALGRALAKNDHASWVDSDLTMAQVRALFTVFRHGPLPVSGVAHHLSIGLPTASHLVDCLVRAGLVERQSDAEDRRVVNCRVTSQGTALVDQATGQHKERMRALLSQLDEETLEGLRRGLASLAELARGEEDSSHAGA
jgi:DNA-binding MarR family transcriptional regulator